MSRNVRRFVFQVLIGLLSSAGLCAQVSPTGTLTGTVIDPSGAAVVGAAVQATDNATGAVFQTKSGPDGSFAIANLRAGTYTVTVTMDGFKKALYRAVKIVVGSAYDLSAKLELGDLTSTIVVEAGQEILETQSATVGTSITGKAITQLPFTSRDALDLAILMPGAATTGRPRQTSFLGLPKGAINITIDGINAQDNLLKSSDGFFTLIRPKVDSIEEFSISTAAQGAEQAGEGAVQIRFETKRGGNAFHGGVWEYLRNDFLNSNYYFNNRDGVKRPTQRLNQYGYKIGGPILKGKLFFFHAFEFYSNPQSQSRTRTILSPDSLAGRFTYAIGCVPGSAGCSLTSFDPNPWTSCVASSPRAPNSGPACTVDLFAVPGLSSETDPTVMSVLRAVETARNASGVRLSPVTTPWVDTIRFNNAGTASRKFPDFRFDWNATKNHQFTAIYHYNHFTSKPDFLNGVDYTFPVAPFNTNQGSQTSNRNQYTTAWRWNLASNKSNEVRVGLQTSPVAFRPDMNLGFYPEIRNNLGTINLRPSFPVVSQPFLTYTPSARNTPLAQLIETFSWARGKHNITFGGSWTEVRFRQSAFSRRANTANVGLSANDPAAGPFTLTNFLGSSLAARTAAGSVYALLTGRVSSYTGTISADPEARQFVYRGPLRQALTQREFGVYASDSWRVWPSFTVTAGLRWEYQGAPRDPLNLTFSLVNGVNDVYGVSGPGNLFRPGTLQGRISEFRLNGDNRWWNPDLKNFAPSLGLAWQPKFENRLLKTVFGVAGKTVFRGGYSISYTREGVNNFISIVYANPGVNGSIRANAVAPDSRDPCPSGSLVPSDFYGLGSYPAGCLTLSRVQAGDMQTLSVSPASFPSTGSFQIAPFAGQSVNVFDPNLKTPRVQSWSVGIQRELTRNMVMEVRYVANHATGIWRQQSLNEVNIFENGFLGEFKMAQSNLAICRANPEACQAAQAAEGVLLAQRTPNNFANWGLPGQVAVPILTRAFTGGTPDVQQTQTNANFRSATFLTPLGNGTAGAFANTLAFNQSFLCNLVGRVALPEVTCPSTALATTNFPVNFWVVNPHATDGTFLFANGSQSTYNALQIEVRRRPSKGLQFSGNYTFSKALTNYYGDSSVSADTFNTLRDTRRDKGPSPWDLRHAFKMHAIYELPFGPGRKWGSSQGWLNRIIEGWELNGIHRWQSGRVFQLTSGLGGTFNQNDPGIILTGITPNQLQSRLRVRKLPTGQVFFFPADLVAGNGQANPNVIAPCTTPGQLCDRIFLHGPQFFRADISVLKKTHITERVNFELRAEFLNAFNNANFFFPGGEATSVPGSSITSESFGIITSAYRDVSTTDDHGGRIVQLVFRINF